MAPPTDTRVVATGLETVIATQNIAAGGTQTASGTVPGACAGRTFTLTADNANSVDEYSESNNSASGSV